MKTYEDAFMSETELLLENINKLNALIKVNDEEIPQMLEKLRQVEKKMSVVYTFFQASKYRNNSQEKEQATTNRPSFKDTNAQ